MTDWVFVIDTDQYAGNFERDMCAYLTGEIGECEVGKEFQEIACKELSGEELDYFGNNVVSVPDEHGCARPTTAWDSPRWYNDGYGNHYKRETGDTQSRCPAYNSVAIWFDKKPTQEAIDLMKKRAAKFAEVKRQIGQSWEKDFKLTIEGFRLIRNIHTEEATNV